MALFLATLYSGLALTGTTIGTQSAHAHGHRGHRGGHVSAMSATGNSTAAHSTAFLYGFGLGKNAGMRGYYDIMNDCLNRPYLSTNVIGAIKHFTSLQQVP